MATSHQVVMQNAAEATGNGTVMRPVQRPNDWCGLTAQVVISGTATITWEGTVDGTNWVSIYARNKSTKEEDTTCTASGIYTADVTGLNQIRARISSYSSGTVTVTGELTAGAASGGGDSGLGGLSTPVVDSYFSAVINLAASTADQVLKAAPGAGKQLWIQGLFMMADTAAGTVTLQDEDDTAHSGTMAVSDEGGWVLPLAPNVEVPWFKVATNKALECDTGAATIDGILVGLIVSV